MPESIRHTDIMLFKGIPCDADYENTLYFDNEYARREYFSTHDSMLKDLHSYQRTGKNSIKVQANYDDIADYNYMIIINKKSLLDMTAKWYYCFIMKMDYINDVTTEITYKVDDIQTWLPDCTFGDSFVERTHVYNDVIGENLVPENLPIGESYMSYYDDFLEETPNNAVVMYTPGQTSKDPDQGEQALHYYGRIVTGAKYKAFRNLIAPTFDTEWYDFLEFLYQYSGKEDFLKTFGRNIGIYDKADNIISMRLVPNHCISVDMGTWDNRKEANDPVKQFYVTVPRHFEDFYPKNRKLYTYPFVCLQVSNSTGEGEVYRFEDFTTKAQGGRCVFNVYGGVFNNPSVTIVPKDYHGKAEEYDSAISIQNFPLIAFRTSEYREFVNQRSGINAYENIRNSINVMGMNAMHGAQGGLSDYATGTLGMKIGGVAGGVVGGAVGGAVLSAIDLADKSLGMMAMQTIPNKIRDFDGNSNINTLIGNVGFHFYLCTIKRDFAERIDEYLTKFGYKVNRVMKPSLKNRERFTYIKTSGLVLNGNVSQEVELNIKKIFDTGITFWVDPEDVGNYEDENAPLGEQSLYPPVYVPNIKDSPIAPLPSNGSQIEPVDPIDPSIRYTPRTSEDGMDTASKIYYYTRLNKAIPESTQLLPDYPFLPDNKSLGCSVYAYGRSLEIADSNDALNLIWDTVSDKAGPKNWVADPTGRGQYLSPNTPNGYTATYPTGENCVNSAILGGWKASDEPQLGALISWSYVGGEASGHVGVVENIHYDKSGVADYIDISESNTNYNPPSGFDTRRVYREQYPPSIHGRWYDPTGAHPKKWTGAFALNPALTR